MSAAKSRRRWLQFTLRTLLVGTLTIAAWLGYEVHQARTVGQQTQAIRALGGEVEFEVLPWSLLRFIEPQTYGRRIVVAQVTGESVAQALPQLEALPALREVRVVFEGTSDHYPTWLRLHEALPKACIVAAAPATDDADDGVRVFPDAEKAKQRCRRFLEKIRQVEGIEEGVIEDVKMGTRYTQPTSKFRLHHYQPLRLSDASLGEVLAISTPQLINRGMSYAFVLLVNDRCIDARYYLGLPFSMYPPAVVSIQDVNGDGRPDLAVEASPASRISDRRWIQTLPGDPRNWLGLYAIEPQGFRNLLPKDRFTREADHFKAEAAESGGTTTDEARDTLPPLRPPAP